MAHYKETTNVVLITKNANLTHEIHQALVQEPGFTLLKSIVRQEELAQLLPTTQPGVILVDFQIGPEDAALRLIDQVAAQYLNTAIVTILPETQVQVSDRVILAGSRAILVHPFPTDTLFLTLRRVRELLFRNLGIPAEVSPVASSEATARSVVLYSPKGGVGCTSVAINLAIALHQNLNQKVLLVDGRHILGHVALMLNLRTGNSISDLLAYVNKLDDALISQVVVEHVSGITVLAGPLNIEKGQDIKPENLFKVFQALKAVYPYIIVDGGSNLDDNLVTYMDMVDKIMMVINPNLASLRDARQFLGFSRTLSYPNDKILTILNQAGHKADVKLSEIEKVLHSKIIGTIPADEDLMLSCVNDGVPIIQKKPKHPISKAIKEIARSVEKILAELAAPPHSQNSRSVDALRDSSYLG